MNSPVRVTYLVLATVLLDLVASWHLSSLGPKHAVEIDPLTPHLSLSLSPALPPFLPPSLSLSSPFSPSLPFPACHLFGAPFFPFQGCSGN